jgi:cephalosporin hydroxylase
MLPEWLAYTSSCCPIKVKTTYIGVRLKKETYAKTQALVIDCRHRLVIRCPVRHSGGLWVACGMTADCGGDFDRGCTEKTVKDEQASAEPTILSPSFFSTVTFKR